MKNATITFPQELVDDLMQSFKDDTNKINRLSRPLSDLSINESDEN